MIKEEEIKKYQFHATISNSGTLEVILYLPSKDLTKEEKENAILNEIVHFCNIMGDKGYIDSIDLEQYNTRKHWEQILKEGKISYKETDAVIFMHLWVEGYLRDKEETNRYVLNLNKVIKSIQATGEKHGRVICPQCGESQFDFNINTNDINGICRADCGFHLYTTN